MANCWGSELIAELYFWDSCLVSDDVEKEFGLALETKTFFWAFKAFGMQFG